jgi:hypothetical protein
VSRRICGGIIAFAACFYLAYTVLSTPIPEPADLVHLRPGMIETERRSFSKGSGWYLVIRTPSFPASMEFKGEPRLEVERNLRAGQPVEMWVQPGGGQDGRAKVWQVQVGDSLVVPYRESAIAAREQTRSSFIFCGVLGLVSVGLWGYGFVASLVRQRWAR